MVDASRRGRVLVVEDEALLAMHMIEVLESVGCEPIGPAMSAVTALPAALHEQIDAALLDVKLIDQSAKPIADVLARRRIPFAFVTSCSRDELPAPHRDRPLLAKPFNDDDLAAAIVDLIAKDV
jgi:CheY-like chemotaxis protein